MSYEIILIFASAVIFIGIVVAMTIRNRASESEKRKLIAGVKRGLEDYRVRLKAGEKLRESGNTRMFANGDFCTAATDIYLCQQKLVKVTGRIGQTTYSWLAQEVKGEAQSG